MLLLSQILNSALAYSGNGARVQVYGELEKGIHSQGYPCLAGCAAACHKQHQICLTLVSVELVCVGYGARLQEVAVPVTHTQLCPCLFRLWSKSTRDTRPRTRTMWSAQAASWSLAQRGMSRAESTTSSEDVPAGVHCPVCSLPLQAAGLPCLV